MNFKKEFLLILLIVLFLSVSVVNAVNIDEQDSCSEDSINQTSNNASDLEKINSKISFNLNSSSYNYNQTVNVDIFLHDEKNNSISGLVNLKLNNDSYDINIKEGYGNFSFSKLIPQKYYINFTYEGNDLYNPSFSQSEFTVEKIPSKLTINDEFKSIKTSDNFKLDFIFESDTEAIAQVYINNEFKQNIFLNIGNNSVNFSSFAEGQYNITIIFPGDLIHESANKTVTVNVSKSHSSAKIYCLNISSGDDEIITIEVSPDNFNSQAILSINGVNNSIFLKGSINNFTISNLTSGTYNVSLIFEGNNRFNKFNVSSSFVVYQSLSKLNVSIEKNNLTAFITVKTNSSKCSGEINLYVNQRHYKKYLLNGSVIFNVDFDVGTNYIYVLYSGDKFFTGSNWNTTVGEAQNYFLLSENIINYEYSDFNYSVILCEENGMAVPNKNITINFLNKTFNITTDNKGIANITLNLKKGNYTIKANYENRSLENNITVESIDFIVNTTDISYLENEIVEVIFKRNITGNINFKLSNNLSNTVKIINNNSAFWNISNLNAGDYLIEVFYTNEFINSSSVIKSFKINKCDVNLNINISQMNIKEVGLISLLFSQNITGNITLIIDNIDYVKNISTNKMEFNFDNLSSGYHNLSIIYCGDNNFNNYTFKTVFSIRNITTPLILLVNDTYFNEDICIIAILDNQTTGNVEFLINSVSYISNIYNGIAILNFSGLNVGNYTVFAKYEGNEQFINSSNKTDFNIKKANSTIDLYVKEVFLDENIRIYANLSPNATGYVTYSMVDYYSPRNKTIFNSTSSWYISPLDTGQYKVLASYSGDDNYYPSNTSFIFNITQQRSVLNVNIADVTSKERVIVRAKLTSKSGIGISGIVNLSINSKLYKLNVKKGACSLILGTLPIGVYEFKAVYDGDENHTKSFDEGSFKITDSLLNVTLKANNIVKHFGGSEKLIISLSDSNGQYIENNSISVKIDNKEYLLLTDGEGSAFLDLNLKPGIYNAVINSNQTARYQSSKINVTIEVLSTIQSQNLSKVYGSNNPYYAVFTDSSGVALNNVNVIFVINNKSYIFATSPNGVARININLPVGLYTIFAKNPITGEVINNTIYIFTYIMGNKDVITYYGAGQTFKVYLLDGNGNRVGKGVNVVFNINGKKYNVKTDKNGYASYKFNLKPKSYVIKVSYNKVVLYNKIIVKPVLYGQNIIVKKGYGFKFKAKLLNSKGKALKGKKVIFNFKGKKYSAKTNKKGYAVITIKLKLKVGKYIIKTKYASSTISNFIKVKR